MPRLSSTSFIFHDVDLIPSEELKNWYTSIPQQPAHIARVWNRYSDNLKYFVEWFRSAAISIDLSMDFPTIFGAGVARMMRCIDV